MTMPLLRSLNFCGIRFLQRCRTYGAVCLRELQRKEPFFWITRKIALSPLLKIIAMQFVTEPESIDSGDRTENDGPG